MANNRYAVGRRFEYRVRDMLTGLGYLVIRTPGSRSPFDLVVLGASGCAFLVQCKVDGRLNPKAWNDFYNVAQSVNALALVAMRVKRKISWRQILEHKSTNGLRKAQPWVHIHVLAIAADAHRAMRAA